MILNRRSVQKLWNSKIQKRVKSGEAICTWSTFDEFLQWYQNEVDTLPDDIYFVDFIIGNWNNLDGPLLISPDTTYIITKEIFDNIKDIYPRKQLALNNPLPIGVAKNPTSFSPYMTDMNKNRLNMGNYPTSEEAFFAYKYYKEANLKQLAEILLSQNRITQRTFNAVYNLPIVSVKVNMNNYNYDNISQLAYAYDNRVRSIKFDTFEQKYLGCRFEQVDGWCRIVEVLDNDDTGRRYVRVAFEENPKEDGTPYTADCYFHNVKAGHIKNPYKILACGGYYGEGPYIANQDMKIYKIWEGMLRRAYLHEESYYNKSAYDNCSVDLQWLNLQRFAYWYSNYRSQLNPKYYPELHIDKDILQWGQEYKIYSPNTCCLIPGELNSSLVYMDDGYYYPSRKEKIKSLSNIYYNDGGITKDIYDAIMNNLRRF